MRRTGFDSQRLERLGDGLARDIERGLIPGAVVLVAHGGQVVYQRAVGWRDRAAGDALQPDAIFRVASMTKPLTVVAALMLVEEGKLQLFAPVADYLPDFAQVQVGVETPGEPALRLEPPARPMTVQDLMRHTSGLTYGAFGDSLVQRRYREARAMDPRQTNAEMAAKLAVLPLAYQPGTTFEYGMSTDVLGRVVEVAAGMELDRVFAERISGPLGMRDTGFGLGADAVHRLAEPHPDPVSGTNPLLGLYDAARPPRWFAGGSGLLSTAADYHRFAQMLHDGGVGGGQRLLARSTVALMTSDHLPPGVAYGPITPLLGITAPLPELAQAFGLGVAVRTHPGRNPNPGSVGDFSWPGISGCSWWADPAQGIVAVLMLQAPAARMHYRALLRDLVYQALL